MGPRRRAVAVKTCSTSPACRPSGIEDPIATRAGSARTRRLIERLEAAGAVLVGALNMGEYAYDSPAKTSTMARPAIRTTRPG